MRRGEGYKPVSNRLRGYDYSQNGAYFITICVKDRQCVFGEIQENKMLANEIGKVVENEIINTEQMRKNVTIDSYVVMPNHIHMIVIIYDDISRSVETHCNASLQHGYEYKNVFGPQKNNLGSIIRGLKGVIKKRVCSLNQGEVVFSWQSNYHDHIIRNEEELQRIRQYIYDNPANWGDDEENV